MNKPYDIKIIKYALLFTILSIFPLFSIVLGALYLFDNNWLFFLFSTTFPFILLLQTSIIYINYSSGFLFFLFFTCHFIYYYSLVAITLKSKFYKSYKNKVLLYIKIFISLLYFSGILILIKI